jgi:hypothetical protein
VCNEEVVVDQVFKPHKKLARSPVQGGVGSFGKVGKTEVSESPQESPAEMPSKEDVEKALRNGNKTLERLRSEEEALLHRLASREQRTKQLHDDAAVTAKKAADSHHPCNTTSTSDSGGSVDSAPHYMDEINSLHKTTDFIDVDSSCSLTEEDAADHEQQQQPTTHNQFDDYFGPGDESFGQVMEEESDQQQEEVNNEEEEAVERDGDNPEDAIGGLSVVYSPSVPVNLSQSLGSPELQLDEETPLALARAPVAQQRAVKREEKKGVVIDIGIPYYVESGMVFEPLVSKPRHHKTVGHTSEHSKKKYDKEWEDSMQQDDEKENSQAGEDPSSPEVARQAKAPKKEITKTESKKKASAASRKKSAATAPVQRKKRFAISMRTEETAATTEKEVDAAAPSQSPVKKKPKSKEKKTAAIPVPADEAQPEVCAEDFTGNDISVITKSGDENLDMELSADESLITADCFSDFCVAMREDALEMLDELQPARKSKKKSHSQKEVAAMLHEMWAVLTPKERLQYKQTAAKCEEIVVLKKQSGEEQTVPDVQKPGFDSSDAEEAADTSIFDGVAAARNKKKKGGQNVSLKKTDATPKPSSKPSVAKETPKSAARTPLSNISDAFTPVATQVVKGQARSARRSVSKRDELQDTPLPAPTSSGTGTAIPFKRSRKTMVEPAAPIPEEGLETIEEETSIEGTHQVFIDETCYK